MPNALHSEKYRKFRELLIEQRNKAGLTQAVVAQQLNKPQSFVSKYEKGERRLDVVEFIEIAQVIGFKPTILLNKL